MKPIELDLSPHLLELVRRTSTDLSADVESALTKAADEEEAGSSAQGALVTILENVRLAREKSSPICQDTGTPIFTIHHPFGYSTRAFSEQCRSALRLATASSFLRPNAVDSLTGINSGDNTGICYPSVHCEEWARDEIQVKLLLKGGGSENVGTQYSLPNAALNAGRNLEGVRRVVLDAVFRAQGKGCSPGVLGIAIGGDRGTSYLFSKEQLHRHLQDSNPDPELAKLENRLLSEINELGIGPMGFGGKTTVFGVKIGALHRLPACFFVSISYMCWANRRRTMVWSKGEVRYE